MFTGLVEECGEVVSFSNLGDYSRLGIFSKICSADAGLGDSICVDGACLTVVSSERNEEGFILYFELLNETINRTHFQSLTVGSRLNLERALAVGHRLGGHFVTGHVDATGVIGEFSKRDENYFLRIDLLDPVQLKYLIEKGSVAINGISLTVAGVDEKGFWVWIIPHTLEVTNLSISKKGEHVNLEFDMIGKYVENFVKNK